MTTRSLSALLAFLAVLVVVAALTACNSRLHGRYEDASRDYIDFRSSGKAFTNIGAGGGETEITYEIDDRRVTLHEVDGNPTLLRQQDGSLCCGPGGVLRRTR